MGQFSVCPIVRYNAEKKNYIIRVDYITDGKVTYPFDYVLDCQSAQSYVFDVEKRLFCHEKVYFFLLKFKHCNHLVVMEVPERYPRKLSFQIYYK